MNLKITGAGAEPVGLTLAKRDWLRALFAVPRERDGSAEQRLALANEESAWQALRREKGGKL